MKRRFRRRWSRNLEISREDNMIAKALAKIEQDNVRKDPLVPFSVGDSVKVHVKIREGDKERIQMYSGTVIGRKGRGSTETFTVRRIAHGVGVERVFPIHSPNVVQLEVEGSTHVRRAKLYFLRELGGKKAKLRERSPKAGPRPSKASAPAAAAGTPEPNPS